MIDRSGYFLLIEGYLTGKAPQECPTLLMPLHTAIKLTPKARRYTGVVLYYTILYCHYVDVDTGPFTINTQRVSVVCCILAWFIFSKVRVFMKSVFPSSCVCFFLFFSNLKANVNRTNASSLPPPLPKHPKLYEQAYTCEEEWHRPLEEND